MKKKENLINDLKLCLQRNGTEMQQIQLRLQKPQNLISETQLKEEVKRMLPMLTPNQFALMTKEKKRVNWTVDEIATGFALSYLGKRGYNFTIHKLGITLPSIRTLQKWGERIKISTGLLYDCFTILNAMGSNFTEEERTLHMLIDMVFAVIGIETSFVPKFAHKYV